jgi:hypothetical protein
MPLTLSVDFDGVIHSFTSGWQGYEVIADPPVPGAFEWLTAMNDQGFEVCIFSARSYQPEGLEAMREWFQYHGLAQETMAALEFPTYKPAAFLTIDDRALCFDGTFPTAEAIRAFRPWYKRA